MKQARARENRAAAALGMSPVDIKVGLLRRGITQKQIADALGVTKVTVNQVVNGKIRSRRVEDYLKRVLIGEVAA
ncbi:helix-turn-helix domain-containing protein [Geobacter sp.]|uniref:helix-turn-helix domain-containing protein n=1 Tax=Geobacter sp. TaxID=46610 RepID=UPI002628AAC3|nr:helix-turn-helix domain-containing protein [Geobacter sp.]